MSFVRPAALSPTWSRLRAPERERQRGPPSATSRARPRAAPPVLLAHVRGRVDLASEQVGV